MSPSVATEHSIWVSRNKSERPAHAKRPRSIPRGSLRHPLHRPRRATAGRGLPLPGAGPQQTASTRPARERCRDIVLFGHTLCPFDGSGGADSCKRPAPRVSRPPSSEARTLPASGFTVQNPGLYPELLAFQVRVLSIDKAQLVWRFDKAQLLPRHPPYRLRDPRSSRDPQDPRTRPQARSPSPAPQHGLTLTTHLPRASVASRGERAA
jgi:hypothetical protein